MPFVLDRPRWETPEPPGVTGTYGDRVIRWASRKLQVRLTGWQAYVIRQVLRHDKAGNLIHRTALVSTARQNGKSVIVRCLIGWLLDEGRVLAPYSGYREILAAAHDADQARLVYRGVYGDLQYIHNPEYRLTQYVGITAGRLTFDTVTSQPGSSRGHSAGLIAWDEVLTQRDWEMYESLSPTQTAQRNPLMLMTSSAGYADSIVLRSFYDRLVRQASGDERPDPSFYGAWWQSEDPEAGLDWRQLQQANPAMGSRLTRKYLASEHAILPPDSWRRERLNHWIVATADTGFAPGAWAACRALEPLAGADPPYTLAVDVEPGWRRATIVAAGVRPDGRTGAEVYRDLRAEDEAITAERLTAEIDAFPDPVGLVVFDLAGAASGQLQRHGAEKWAQEWRGLRPGEVVAASMDLASLVNSSRLAVDDPLLDHQMAVAARRPVGSEGAFRFSRQHSAGPIDALMALVFAVYGAGSLPPWPHIA